MPDDGEGLTEWTANHLCRRALFLGFFTQRIKLMCPLFSILQNQSFALLLSVIHEYIISCSSNVWQIAGK